MKLHRIRAVYMRGGTSKALVFKEADLPAARADRDAIFLAAMGVPDPNRRQLDGMGGGLSSLNKVCIVGPPSRADADVDFTFVQLGVDTPLVDYGGNCGNMSAAIGPFAIEEGLVPCPAEGEAVVRIHNTNTGKLIRARFAVTDGALAADGTLAIDGVAGTAAPVRLEFLAPGGAKTGRLLPTGHAIDRLCGIEASLVDAANPCIFVAARSLGLAGTELPSALDENAAFLAQMEDIRRAGSVAMGLAPDIAAAGRLASVPKVAMLSGPGAAMTVSGRRLAADETDLTVRMISVGQPHRAVPITGAICLAVAARLPGTIAQRFCANSTGPIRIGHASGTTTVDAEVEDGEARHGAVYRSARRLFEGHVIYRS